MVFVQESKVGETANPYITIIGKKMFHFRGILQCVSRERDTLPH